MTDSELHQYIHNVLEKGDHGKSRIIEFDGPALNDAIERHATKIAQRIKAGAKEAFAGLDFRKKTVHNYLGNIVFRAIVEEPSSLEELVQVMVRAKKEKQKVRAVGAFHAWSPLCVTPGILVKTDNLVGTVPTPTATLKDPDHATAYYDVLSGTSWKEAAVELEKHGRALMNIGGYSGLHVGGATSTGTHGSGLKIPPLAGMIRGVTLVSAKFGADGTPIVYRIEPTNGITDPKKHTGNVQLIQEDATFNAVIVGLCAFGVIYSYTIETKPFYWVIETRQATDWDTAKKLLQEGPDGDILKYHNAEVWMNAYTKQCLITRRQVSEEPPEGAPAEDKSISAFLTLVKQLPALEHVLAALKLDVKHLEDDTVRELGQILALILKEFPLLIPFGVGIALTTQAHAEPKVGKYYDIYDIGLANRFPAISIEISYPMSTYIAATESALDSFEKLRAKKISKALAGFLSLRFTSGLGANLSMSYSPEPAKSDGRCYLEIFSLFAIYKSIKGFDEVVGPVQLDSIKNFQGRLHWGQYLTSSFTVAKYKKGDPEYYDSIKAWTAIAEKFDPNRMMRNDFMKDAIFSAV